MKYKVGDRVKVKSEFDFYEEYRGKQFVIEECDSSDDTYLCHPATRGYRIWFSEEKLEPVVPTLAEIKENNLRCVIKVDSKEEAVKLFEIFNPNDYDVNYVYDYLMVNYCKGDGTACFGIAGNKINGFDTETSYKENEEQYGKIYRFKDLVAKGGIVTLKPRDESVSFASAPYLDLSLVLPTNSRELEEKFNEELAKHFNTSSNGFRGGKKPEYVLNEKQAKEYADNIMATAKLISDTTGISYESSINKLKTCLGTFPNDGISAKNGGKNSMKFTFYVTEGTRPDKNPDGDGKGVIPTMTTEVLYKDNDGCANGGSATCDKADYNERQGCLEAIANAVLGGNFDREYEKFLADKKRKYNESCKCKICGRNYYEDEKTGKRTPFTPEDARKHEEWHEQNKQNKRERYLLRKRAKEIAFEEAAQKMAKEMMGEQK